MSETKTGDPVAALSVTGSDGCCGNPPRAATALPDPVDTAASPCCGTPAEAQEAGGCCGTQARTQAVATGAGCCT